MHLSPATTRWLRTHGVNGLLRPIAAPVYRAVVAQQLLAVRVLDALAPRRQDPALLDRVTALIKTFERPYVLTRLLASIRRLYPTLRVIVVDDSREPVRLDGIEVVPMPYDSGISAGRNEGLRRVATPYVLLLDDDLILSRSTRLAEAVALMDRHPAIDIMGGEVYNLPVPGTPGNDHLLPTTATPHVPLGSSIGGLTVRAKVSNFFVARVERLALVPWDARLKRIEHTDFFTRAFGVLTTVENPRLRAFHAKTPFDAEYMRTRMDVAHAEQVLAERYGLPRGSRPPGP